MRGGGTLVTRYLDEGEREEAQDTFILTLCNLKNNWGTRAPPSPPARQSLWLPGRMLKLRTDRNKRSTKAPCGLGKHNDCLKYVC